MLFPKVNEQATKIKVDELLSKYHSIRRIAGMVDQKVTATFSIEPKSFTGTNSDAIGGAVATKIDMAPLYNDITKAINSLDAYSRKRIFDKYINGTRHYDYEVYHNENISEATYYREVGKAMIEFAEAFQNGSLLVLENE